MNLYWVEEPVFPPEDFEKLSKIKNELGIKIAAGENGRLFAQPLFPFQIDLFQNVSLRKTFSYQLRIENSLKSIWN